MTNTFTSVSSALDEIRFAYEREVMRWYRIRRQCVKRGMHRLAERILIDIEAAQRDLSHYDFRNFDYYDFMFQLDNPDRKGRYLGRPLLRDWDGE